MEIPSKFELFIRIERSGNFCIFVWSTKEAREEKLEGQYLLSLSEMFYQCLLIYKR